MSAATWPRLCLLRHNLTQLTDLRLCRRAQFIACLFFPAIITRPRRIGLERVRCRLSPWGESSPQSDPRRRLGRPLTERRNGARLRQCARFELQPVATPIPRETVPFDGGEAPGTIVIRTSERRLYFVLPDHQALRYGVGVGRPGFTWAGVTRIGYKREWPDWTPPAQMLRRRPDLPRHMEGGIDNPLGARAMYLAARPTESMARTSPTRSGRRFRPAASA